MAGVVLAAGAGTRLAPLTQLRPKALCPVGDRPLLDHALDRLGAAAIGGERDVAVNAHRFREQVAQHVAGRALLSVEEPDALGTAGALGRLRDWIAGRPVLVTNADAWLPDADLGAFVDGWDGERTRLLVVADHVHGDFGQRRYCGAALMPWAVVRELAAVPSGLYEVSWDRAWADGRLDLVTHGGPFIDCGTPMDYLAANLTWSGGANVIGEDAVVASGARLERSVVWPGAEVRASEKLAGAVRYDRGRTLLVR